jgi:prepilin peptidase CpaA
VDAGRIGIDVLLVLILLGATVTDCLHGKIYNALTYPAIGCGLVLNTVVQPAGVGLGAATLGFAVAFLPMLLGFLAGGIGGGDVKMMGAVGAFLGFEETVTALLCVFLVAVALVGAWVVFKEGFVGLLVRVRHAFSPVPDEPREERLRFPFALAILLGVAWALVEARAGYGLVAAGRGLFA